jgi:hypothetical protein
MNHIAALQQGGKALELCLVGQPLQDMPKKQEKIWLQTWILSIFCVS